MTMILIIAFLATARWHLLTVANTNNTYCLNGGLKIRGVILVTKPDRGKITGK